MYEERYSKIPLYENWLQEYHYLMDVRTKFNKLCILKRFAVFFTRTLDKIADHDEDELIPEFLFDIRYLMT